MPSARDCAERLREQAYRTLLPQIRDLEEELQNIKGSLSTGIHQIGEKLDSLRHIELPTTELILGEILEEVVRQKDLETSALVLFARGLRQKETQEEILTFLLDSAQKYFPRVALFAVRGDRFVGWSSRGYSEPLAGNISSCTFARSECHEFQRALESESPITASSLTDGELLRSLQENAQGPWRLFSLRVLQRPAALLMAGEAEGIECNPDALSVLVDLAALRLENIALKILYELTAAKPEAVPKPMPAEAVAAVEPVAELRPSPVIPEVPVQVQAEEPVIPAPEQIFEPVSIPEPAFIPEPVAMPEPAPWAEAVAAKPAVEEFAVPVEEHVEIPIPVPQPEIVKAPPPEPRLIPEEERLHTDAKRFARLLVSEIKLYNEHHVAEGRVNRDLYLRLKRDIDRSREMYEKRISPSVARKIDYFHDEIIRILGDNDPSTLGSDYPGPRVEN